MDFDYINNIEILINGEKHFIRFENGMTGIGSRKYWIDDKEQFWDVVRQSKDITKGNHFIYTIKWRDTPWDKVDIIVSEEELPVLLTEENKWRTATKREIP